MPARRARLAAPPRPGRPRPASPPSRWWSSPPASSAPALAAARPRRRVPGRSLRQRPAPAALAGAGRRTTGLRDPAGPLGSHPGSVDVTGGGRNVTFTVGGDRHRRARRGVRHRLRLRQSVLARLRPIGVHLPRAGLRRQVGRHRRDPALDPRWRLAGEHPGPRRPPRQLRDLVRPRAAHPAGPADHVEGQGDRLIYTRTGSSTSASPTSTAEAPTHLTVTAVATDRRSGIASIVVSVSLPGTLTPLVHPSETGDRVTFR